MHYPEPADGVGPPAEDIAAFAAAQLDHGRAIAADADLQRLSVEATTVSDRHNYSYVWRWLGVPIIQMPTDVVAIQEVIWETRPQVIVETGIARGGSVLLYSSILELIGEGTVLAIDIDLRDHNRRAIESHPLSHRVQIFDGSSTDPSVVAHVHSRIGDARRVMVVLDSNHTHEHVLEELHRYAPMVTPGQFLIVADTIVEDLPAQEHRPRPWGPGDNPKTALDAFLSETDRFVIDPGVNNKLLMTSSPGAYLRCIK